MADNFYADYPVTGGVTSLDGMTGALTLVAGAGISIVDAPGTITISATSPAGANVHLSNLSAPTAVNVDLLPGPSDALNIGADSHRWNRLVANEVASATSGQSYLFAINAGFIYNASGNESIGLDGTLYNGISTPMFSWQGSGQLNAHGHLINNVVDPVSPQDAATKAYVDGASSGANTFLSNLTAPTAINRALLPGPSDALNLGADGNRWNRLVINEVAAATSGNSYLFGVNAGFIYNAAGNESIGLDGTLYNGISTPMFSWQGTGQLNAHGHLINNVVDPVNPQDAATKNYVDTAGGGANTALSNLVATAINQSLISDTDNTYDFGSTASRWKDIYAFTAKDSAGNISVNISNRQLVDSTASLSIDYQNRALYDEVGNPAISYISTARVLSDAIGNPSIDFTNSPVNIMGDPDAANARTLALYDASSSGFVGIKATDAVIASPYTVILPAAQGTGALTNDGAGNLSWTPDNGITALTGDATATGPGSAALTLATVNGNVGSFTNASITVNAKGLITAASSGTAGANTALSNLASVAINTSLLPGTTNVIDLGSSSKQWANVYVGDGGNGVQLYSGIAERATIYPNFTTPSGLVNAAGFQSFTNNAGGTSAFFGSGSNSGATAGGTGAVVIETGNKTAGTGSSGFISLRTGTSSGGTRGTIRLLDGSEGTSGQVWTSINTGGAGHWAVTPIPADVARWTKYTFNFGDFSAASPTNDLLVVNVPIEGIVSAAFIKPTIQFAGSGITTVTMSVGSAFQGTACLGTQEVAAVPVSGTTYVFTNFTPTSGLWSGDFTATDEVRIYATADGNLDQLTDGQVEVWLKIEAIPAP